MRVQSKTIANMLWRLACCKSATSKAEGHDVNVPYLIAKSGTPSGAFDFAVTTGAALTTLEHQPRMLHIRKSTRRNERHMVGMLRVLCATAAARTVKLSHADTRHQRRSCSARLHELVNECVRPGAAKRKSRGKC